MSSRPPILRRLIIYTVAQKSEPLGVW